MADQAATATTPSTLLEGGYYYEGARWREGRWYVSDIFADAVLAVEEDGNQQTILEVPGHPSGLGWLPDGSLLVNALEDRALLRRAPDGTTSVHADISEICPYGPNDMASDGRGYAWVGTIGFDIFGGETPRPGAVYSVSPEGKALVAAEELWCPNGLVVSGDGSTLIVAESFASRLTAFAIGEDGSLSDRRTFAQIGEPPEPASSAEEMLGSAGICPDGLAIDSEDGVWAADAIGGRCLRFAPDGTVTDEVKTPEGLNAYACALGGSDGHTLLICAHPDFFEAAQGRGLGEAKLLTSSVAIGR